MMTLLDYRTTLNYLAYLGYDEGDIRQAVHVTRSRKADRKKNKVTRNVFLCYVFGAKHSGKSSLLRSFINKSFGETKTPIPTSSYAVVNTVEMRGSEKYLVVSNSQDKTTMKSRGRRTFIEVCFSHHV
jgi:Ras family protein T1